MTRVENISVLAKPSPSEDFDLVQRRGTPPSPELLDLARTWLQAHVDSGNDQSVTIVRCEGRQWLFRGAEDPGTDNAGRPLCHLVLGRIVDPLDPSLVTRLLFGAFRQRTPARDSGESGGVELGPASAGNGEVALRAILALTIGVSRVAVVDNDATATTVIESFPPDFFAFVSLMRRGLPARWPAGTGVVVSQSPWEAPLPASVGRLTLDGLRGLDLAALRELPGPPLGGEERAALLRAGVDGSITEGDLDRLGEDAFDWLLRTPAGRRVALRRAAPEQIVRWLRGNVLDAEEVRRVTGQLPPAELQRHWRTTLLTGGLPERVYDALFLGGAAPKRAPSEPPAPAPNADWVRLIPKNALWSAGRWACSDPGWRRYWSELVLAHPELGASALPSLDGDWSEPLGAWLLDSTAAAELEPASVRAAWRRWNAAVATRPEPEWQARLARAAGLELGDAVEGLLAGDRSPEGTPSPPNVQVVRALLEVGALGIDHLVAAVEAGADVAWLEAAGYDAAALALVGIDRAPPADPPRAFPSALDPLLARACTRPRFWQRFEGQLTRGMLTWLADRLGTQVGGIRLRSYLAGYDAAQRLALTDLEVLALALPAAVVCRQAVAWASAAEPERRLAIEALLRAPSLRPDLRRWLAAELLSASPSPPPPPLDSQETIAVLPLLHPVRDVLRPLLAEPQELPAEAALIEALMPALLRFGGPPLAPPDAASLARHPALARALAHADLTAAGGGREPQGRQSAAGSPKGDTE